MYRNYSIGFTVVILLQLINIQSSESSSSSLTCKSECSSVLYETDWMGERLQFKLNNDENLDEQVKEIGISLSDKATNVNFTCSRRKLVTKSGPTIITTYPNDKVTLVSGSSIYLNDDQLWCDWTINREDNSTFPLDLIEPVKLIVSPTEYKVIIHLNETLPIAPINLSSLPDALIEQFKDYKSIGNSRYLLFTKISDKINFALVVNYEDGVKQLFPSIVTINLNHDPYRVTVNCDFGASTVNGQLMFAGKQFWDDLTKSYDYKGLSNNQIVNETICQWSIPKGEIHFGSKFGLFEFQSAPLNLSIVADNRFNFFTQSNFKLTSSSTSIIFKPFIFITLIIIKQLIV